MRSWQILNGLGLVFTFTSVDGFVPNNSARKRQVCRSLDVVNGDSPSTTSSKVALPHQHVAEATRPDFPILTRTVTDKDHPLVYLDSAATSQKPQAVLDVVQEYYERTNSNVHRGAHTLSREATAAYEATRDKVTNLINANSRNEIIFTGGATESINLVVQTYIRKYLSEGDEVVTTECEHHANIVPYQMIAEEKGLVVRYVKMDEEKGGLDLDHFRELVTEKTKFVGFQHVSNALACINPVQDIVEMIRENAHPECKILLDACQSVPHMVVDAPKLGVDFLVASGHKMCAPTGIGFLWGKEDILNSMPPYKGGGEMIDQVTLEGSTFQPSPTRFEAGTPAIAQVVGLGAAIDYMNKIGMEEIEAYEMELGAYLYQELSKVDGLQVYGPKEHRSPLCCFWHPSVHPSDMGTFLDIEGVAVRAGHHCCQPLHTALGISHSARASLAFYNTPDDVDALVKHLKDTVSFFENLDSPDGDSDDDFVPFI